MARLLQEQGFAVVAQAASADEALAAALREQPDVILLDVRMPPGFDDEGLQVAYELTDRAPSIGVLVLSHHIESDYALALLKRRTRGVGYLLKDHVTDLEMLGDAVRRVGSGGAVVDRDAVHEPGWGRKPAPLLAGLTERDREVLELIAEGRSNRGIERPLVLSPKTVETHVRILLHKLGLAQVEDNHRRVLAARAHLRHAGP